MPSNLLRPLNIIPPEYRFGGKKYVETLNFILESEKWDILKLRKYQAHALKQILSFAVKNVPFYENIKLKEDAFKDIQKFPLLTKIDVINNFAKLVSKNIKFKDAFVDTTGGSSGKQLRFYSSNSLYAIEWAFLVALWKRVGYEPGDRIISFKGGSIRFGNKFWRYDPIYNALALSPFHMNSQTLQQYIEKIQVWKPKFIFGYPSAITIISKYILENQISLPQVKAALLCSEKLYPYQRELIEKAFRARVFSWYGQSEKVILAGECEVSQKYHVFPQYGFTEFFGEDASIVEESLEDVELVGTSFFNFSMPMIRYRMDDYVTLSDVKKCKCGRSYILIDCVKGRWLQEMVLGKHGSLISLTALNIHSEELKKVYVLQYYQDTPGFLILRIRHNGSFSYENQKRVIAAFEAKVGHELDIIIDTLTEIEVTQRGKTNLLVQKLDLSEWWNSL